MGMTPEQIDGYLAQPRVADLVTLNADGSPHIAPVWYHYDGAVVKVFTETGAVKVRNIRRDGRAALSVAAPGPPNGYVIVNGNAAVAAGDPDDVRAMAKRYMSEQDAAAYIAELQGAEFCAITIAPTKIFGWSE